MKEVKRLGGVLVKVNGECLLCKRGHKASYPNTWSVPGGHIEKGETTKEGALREFYEETDIDISDYDLDLAGVIVNRKKTDNKIKSLMYVYLLPTHEYMYPNLETAQDGHEHTECGYFGLDKIKKLTIGTNLRKIIESILTQD